MSDDPAPWIAEHLARGTYAALAERAAAIAASDPAGAARARGELAWLGLGPAYDLVAAARQAIAAGDPAAAAAIDGDGIDARQRRAALWAWRDGAIGDAATLVRRVAGDIRASQPTAAGRVLLADAEAALAAIDRDGARPRWCALAAGPQV